ncbi:MAG: hypothetical protein ACAH80_01720 [Alphaproteobacteria bacterium]
MSDDDSLSSPRHIGPYTLTAEGVQWSTYDTLRWRDIVRFSIVGDLLKGRGVALHETAFEGGFGMPDAKAPKPRVVLYTRGTGQTPEGLMLQLERWRDHHGAAKSAATPKKHPPPPKPVITPPPKPEAPPQTAVWERKPEPEPQAEQEPTRLHPPKEKRDASNTNKRVVTQVSRSYSSTSVNVRNGRITEMVSVEVDSPPEPRIPLEPKGPPAEQASVNMTGPFLFVAAVALAGAVFFENYKKGLLTFLCMAIFMWMCVGMGRQYRRWTRDVPFRSKMMLLFIAGCMWCIFWNTMGHPWIGNFGLPFVLVCGPLFIIATLLV